MTDVDPGDRPVVFEWDRQDSVPDGCYPEWLGKNLPMWFRMLKSVTDDGTRTVKLCSSFADTMRLGYSIPAPCDIEYGYDESGEFAVTADSDADVTVYGEGEPERDANSTFTPPEFAIPNPWKIHTPDECATLVTYPMNRPSNDFRAYSMYVDTDEYDGRIPIPVGRADSKEGVIEAGTIIAQVIPVQRDAIANDWKVGDSNTHPKKFKMNVENQQQTLAVEGFYRRFCWEPKPAQRVSTQIDRTDLTERSLTDLTLPEQGLPSLATDESPIVMVPDLKETQADPPLRTPKPPSEFGIPEWIQDPEPVLGDGNPEELISTWARQAMDLGWMMPFTEKMEFELDGDDFEYEIEDSERKLDDTNEERPHGSVGMHPEGRFGGDLSRFPIPFNIVRAGTVWNFRTPDDHSLLIREPLNHRQELYRSWSGWADADNYTVDGNSIGNFAPRDDGEYEIEAGEANCSFLAIHRDAVLSPATIVE